MGDDDDFIRTNGAAPGGRHRESSGRVPGCNHQFRAEGGLPEGFFKASTGVLVRRLTVEASKVVKLHL